MFKSIHCIHCGSNGGIHGFQPPLLVRPADNIYMYRYEITDTDFVEEWVGPSAQWLSYAEVRCGAIISCYQNKDDGNYVAYNLALYHRYMQDKYSWYKLEDEIGYNCQWTPWYKDYLPEVRKCLERMDNLKAFW